jgi:hypothetical protein
MIKLNKTLPQGLYKAPALTDRPIERAAVVEHSPLLRQRAGEYVFFNLGAIYEIVKVQSDVAAQFRVDCRYDGELQTYEFDRPVLHGLTHWGTVVQGIPKPHAETFRLWALNLLFVDRATRTWWRPMRRVLQVTDPGRVDRGGVLDVDDVNATVELWVVAPFGNHGAVHVTQNPAGSVPRLSFVKLPPPKGTEPDPGVWNGLGQGLVIPPGIR